MRMIIQTYIALLLLACLVCFCVLDNYQTIDQMRRAVEQIFNKRYGMVDNKYCCYTYVVYCC